MQTSGSGLAASDQWTEDVQAGDVPAGPLLAVEGSGEPADFILTAIGGEKPAEKAVGRVALFSS